MATATDFRNAQTIIDDQKLCSECRRIRPVSAFGNWKHGSSGLSGHCRECQSRRMKEHHAKLRAADPEGYRKWRRDATHRHRVKKEYGLTVDQYDAMVAAQGGCCAICGLAETSPGKRQDRTPRRLCVDHDHVTGQVRGLLCDTCNTGIGRFRDDPALVASALAYLIQHSED